MKDLMRYALKIGEKLGASQVEAFGSYSISRDIEAEKNEIKIATSKTFRAVGIRVIYEGGIGFSYTATLDKESIEKAVKEAIKVAKLRGKDPYYISFPDKEAIQKAQGIFYKETSETPLETMVQDILDMIKITLDYDKRITSVGAGYSIGVATKYITNSLGIDLEEKYASSSIGVYAVAEENNQMTSGYEFQAERNVKKLDIQKVALEAAKMTIKLLNPQKIETRKMHVLLKPLAVASLLGPTLINSLRADNVQEKRSFLIGKLNSKISTDELNIVDNALLPDGLSSRSFDDEGVPSKKIYIIKNGVLKSYLHNSYTAQREKIENTAHASRRALSEPSISPSNFIIEHKNEKEIDDLISEIDKGVIANSLIGAHTANPVTGEFSVALGEVFYIESGEIKYPVKQAMIGSNALEMLGKIDMLGKDKRQIGSVFTGTLSFAEITVSG